MSAVVSQARKWIGTPYLHQGAHRGHGCDCLGLIRGIWRELYGAEPEKVPQYTFDWGEAQGAEVLLEAARRVLQDAAKDEMALGQVLLFRMRKGAIAKHLGVISACGAQPRFIHAYVGHGVVESPLSPPWLRKVVARFDFPKGVI